MDKYIDTLIQIKCKYCGEYILEYKAVLKNGLKHILEIDICNNCKNKVIQDTKEACFNNIKKEINNIKELSNENKKTILVLIDIAIDKAEITKG
jgi:hypothetical protein